MQVGNRAYTVGEVARMAGVTVRTLHHYDQIGLLAPSGRSDAGYRLYEQADLKRLQEVLFFRELGIGLDEIRALMDEPGYDRVSALRRHHRSLSARRDRITELIGAVERELDATTKGITMNAEDMLEVFGDFDPADYTTEAVERWGASDAYRESQRRTSQYTKEDWLRMKAESDANLAQFAELFRSGAAPDGEPAMDAAAAHRRHISTWFYDCGYDIHRALAEMYVQDARFTAFYDDLVPGLAQFVSAAIIANARRSE